MVQDRMLLMVTNMHIQMKQMQIHGNKVGIYSQRKVNHCTIDVNTRKSNFNFVISAILFCMVQQWPSQELMDYDILQFLYNFARLW